MTSIQASSTTNNTTTRLLSGILHGVMRGAWIGAILLSLAEAYRPGFLALGEAAGWTAIFVILTLFCILGGLGGWVVWSRHDYEYKHSHRFQAAGWVLVLLLPLVGHAVRPEPPHPRLSNTWRVILFGMDGATWDIIGRLTESGELLNFQRLAHEGVTGTLRSEDPTMSPRVWTTIATGVGPDRHGALDFYATQASIEVPRIWEVVEARGGTIGVWGWLLTWPPGTWNGFLVPGWLAKGPETWPPDLWFFQALKGGGARSVEISTLFAAAVQGYRNGLRFPTLLEAVRVALWMKLANPTRRQSIPYTQFLQSEISTDIFVHWTRKTGPDFSALVLYPTDTLAHHFWRDFEPEKFGMDEGPDGGRYAEVIPDAYRQADRVLGRLMRAADERTVIVVVSDHGAQAWTDTYRKYSIQSGALIRVLNMEGQINAFSVGGYVHMRQLDWDGTGIAPPFVDKLSEATVDGERLFEVKPSDPPFFTVAVHGNPDPSKTARFGERLVPLTDIFTVSEFTGGHSLDGIIGFWGPPIRKGGLLEAPTIRDVAPTILTLLGCPLSREMTGRVLREALTEQGEKELRIHRVDSYGPPPHRMSGKEAPAEVDKELKKKLRSLGYLQ